MSEQMNLNSYETTDQSISEWKAKFEALLFVSGEPIPTLKFAADLELTQSMCEMILEKMVKQYEENPSSALRLKQMGESWALVTKPKYKDLIGKFLNIQNEAPLSRQAYETLSIVAYNQPVTRAQIDFIRGVNSHVVLNRLLAYNLVEACGQSEAIGHPMLYRVTERFLMDLDLKSTDQLPPMEMLMYASLQNFEDEYNEIEQEEGGDYEHN